MKTTRSILFVFLIMAFSMPIFVFANGGDQRIVEGKYYINLSRAPFTPRIGDKVQMLASFVDLKTNKLVAEDLIVRVRISRLGGVGSAKRTFVFDQENFQVKGGVLDLTYTFQDAGLHEIFFDFALASNPEKIYEAPDFLLDIQTPLPPARSSGKFLVIGVLFSTMVAFVIGMLIGRKMQMKQRL